jgi:predicted DCC family thiol-disulfide oxidoreductase YuxK
LHNKLIAHDDAMKNMNTINVLYDGNSVFCSRTAKLVKRLDRGECIHLTNVADRKFEPQIYGKSQSELTGDIYAQLPDGTWIHGADAFRELFAKTGLRPIAFLSKIPLLKQVCNFGYRCFMNTRRVKRRPASRKPMTRAAVSTTFSSGTPIGH